MIFIWPFHKVLHIFVPVTTNTIYFMSENIEIINLFLTAIVLGVVAGIAIEVIKLRNKL